jgi:putative membrane protein
MPTLPDEVRVFVFTIIYAALGMFLLYVGYRIFDRLTPTDLQADIFKDGNVAAAILAGSFIIGLAIVILAAIHG